MSFYFPNVDPAFVYQRPVDQYIDLVETEIVADGYATLKEIPLFSNKVTVKKTDGTTLQEVTTDILSTNQYRVDYSTGIVYFNGSMNGQKLTFSFKGTGYVSFPATRVYVDSNTNAQNKSIQQLVNDLDNNYKNNWKTAVSTYADIATTYPSPVLGDTVQTISDSKIYRFNGTSWIFTQQYSASAITDAQNKIGDLNTLKTTAKNSLVASLNEDHDEVAQARGTFGNVKNRLDDIDARTGSLSNLGTVSKVNLVGAINENKNNISNAEKKVEEYFVNVKQYGATGTGSNNDTAAINTVLELASTNGSVHCYIPDGVYWITGRLYVYGNTKITMGKNTVLLRKWGGGFFYNGGKIGESFTGYNGYGNIIIDGGTLDGNWAQYGNDTIKTFDAIGLARGENMIFRNMKILDVVGAHAFDINACKNVLIENCIFKGYNTSYYAWNDNVSNFREAIQISNHTQAGYGIIGAFDGTPCENITVRNCYFGASNNLPAYPSGVGNHGSVYNKYNRNIKVYGNTFDGMLANAVRSFKFADMMVFDNKFEGCYTCFAISNPDGNSSETDPTQGDAGHPQAAKNNIFHNNVCRNFTAYGVYAVAWEKNGEVDKLDGLIISNNVFDTQTGQISAVMSLHFINNLLITGNIFKNLYKGIYSKFSTNVNISNNTFESIQNFGVYLEENIYYAGKNYTGKIRISNNLLKDVSGQGIYVHGFNDSTANQYNIIQDVRIEDNHLDNVGAINSNYAIDLYMLNHVKVKGNRIKNAYGGTYSGFVANLEWDHNTITDVVVEGIYTNENTPAWNGLGLSNNLFFRNNIIKRAGRTGIFVQYSDNFEVIGNSIDTVGTSTDTDRNGIYITQSSKNGRIFNNKVKKNTTGVGNVNLFGISVTTTCQSIQTFNNNVEGKSGAIFNGSTGGFDGFIDYASTWTNLTLQNGVTAYSGNDLKYCKIGNVVYIRAAFSNITANNTIVATLPAGYRPLSGISVIMPISSVSNVSYSARWTISSNGNITIEYPSAGASFTASGYYPLNLSFVAEA
jgi:parallel beta-helix repeat protein